MKRKICEFCLEHRKKAYCFYVVFLMTTMYCWCKFCLEQKIGFSGFFFGNTLWIVVSSYFVAWPYLAVQDLIVEAGDFIIAFDKEKKEYFKKKVFDKNTFAWDFNFSVRDEYLFKRRETNTEGTFYISRLFNPSDDNNLEVHWSFDFDSLDKVLNRVMSRYIGFDYRRNLEEELERRIKRGSKEFIFPDSLYVGENKLEISQKLKDELLYLGVCTRFVYKIK